jgi:hypothetical protein
MTNTQSLRDQLQEAVELSNWYFGENPVLCEYWHNRACELTDQLVSATGESA